jgi:hypothetical protein
MCYGSRGYGWGGRGVQRKWQHSLPQRVGKDYFRAIVKLKPCKSVRSDSYGGQVGHTVERSKEQIRRLCKKTGGTFTSFRVHTLEPHKRRHRRTIHVSIQQADTQPLLRKRYSHIRYDQRKGLCAYTTKEKIPKRDSAPSSEQRNVSEWATWATCLNPAAVTTARTTPSVIVHSPYQQWYSYQHHPFHSQQQ